MRLVVTSSNRVDKTVAAIRTAAWTLVEDAAETAKVAAIESIKASVGSGAKYPGLPNRSSAPSEIPVNQMGEIVKSIKTYAKPLGPSSPAAEFGSDNPAVPALDRGSNRVAARPFMSEAAEAGRKVMEESKGKMGRIAKNL